MKALREIADPVLIVLGRLEEDFRVVGERRTDLGERPKVETFQRPVTMVWLLSGTPEDVVRARAYAAREGYQVFCYLVTEQDPLGRAKTDLLAQVEAKPAKAAARSKS